MARSRSTRRPDAPAGPAEPSGFEPQRPGVLITFRPGAEKEAVAAMRDVAGVRQLAYAADFAEGAVDMAQAAGSDVLVFGNLGVAVADVDPDQVMGMMALSVGESGVYAVEPEPVFFALGGGLPEDALAYLRGYRDAVEHLYQKLAGGATADAEGAEGASAFQDTAAFAWGLLATKVTDSRFSGRGVKVAVLDTGLDLDHPDFRDRMITSQSFIRGQEVQDENGHGTHCVGTACGPRVSVGGRRYGVAYDSEIFVGKVLSNQGSSLGRSTIAGIEWAVANGCQIVSMSLGGPVAPGQRYLEAFERLGQEALRRGTLVIAAAGNESRRSRGEIAPVGSPANAPSIMSVAAVDRSFRVANFSNGAINPDGRVDLAGPGVDTYSSAPDPAAPLQPPFFRRWSARFDTISGTSMATPHVSGIAALYKQADPQLSAEGLRQKLVSTARALTLPARDVGVGLVQAP